MADNKDKLSQSQLASKKVEELLDQQTGENAAWKTIQQKTFTRWVNKHISRANKQIENLRNDLSDGIRLISLVEVCSSRTFAKYNRRPVTRIHRIENVSIALDFLAKEENIRLVNIDCVDIVDGQLKLICGLVWTLVKHYDISMPVWDGEEESATQELSPRKRLLMWISNKLPELRIRNFTSDWVDGKALGALVDAVAPGLCPDWEDFKPEDRLENLRKVMQLAQKWLLCENLISAEDITNPALDEQSMMTYLSQFPMAKLQEGAPLSRRCNPNRVRVYGAGVQPTGISCGMDSFFTVDTFSAGEGKLKVFLTKPSGERVEIPSKFNNDQHKTYTCKYRPTESGEYKIEITYSGQPVPRSPFVVVAEKAQIEPSKVRVIGDTLNGKSKVGKVHLLELDATEAGIAVPEVHLKSPSGKQLPVKIKQRFTDTRGDEVYRVEVEEESESIEKNIYVKKQRSAEDKKNVQENNANDKKKTEEHVAPENVKPMSKYWLEYVCEEAGEHELKVSYGGQQIPQCPLKLKVERGLDVTKVATSGRGVDTTAVRAGQEVSFVVDTSGTGGEGQLQVHVVDAKGNKVAVKSQKTSKEKNIHSTTHSYTPKTEGRHEVHVQLDGQHVVGSPFEVNVRPEAIPSKARAFGAGLTAAMEGRLASVAVCTNGEPGPVRAKLSGPGDVHIQMAIDEKDSSVTLVEYECAELGTYKLDLTVGDRELPDSPYMVQVRPAEYTFQPQRAHLHPPMDVCVGRPTLLRADLGAPVTSSPPSTPNNIPPEAKLHVLRLDELAEKVLNPLPDTNENDSATANKLLQDAVVNRKRSQSLEFEYIPAKQGRHLLWLECDGLSAGGRPLGMDVRAQADVSSVKLTGTPLSGKNVPLGEQTSVRIENVREGKLEVWAVDLRSGRALPVRLEKHNESVYEAHFRPVTAGRHQLLVTVDGRRVTQTPTNFEVAAPFDVKNVSVNHLYTTAYVNSVNSFIVDTRSLSIELQKDFKLNCEIRDQSGLLLPVKIKKLADGRYECSYEPQSEEKPTKVTVKATGNEPAKVRLRCVEASICGRLNQLILDTRNAGQVTPTVKLAGPGLCEAQMLPGPEPGTYLVEYGAITEGDYELTVQLDGKPLPDGPTKLRFVNEKEITGAEFVHVRDLDTVRSGVANEFEVDASALQTEVISKSLKSKSGLEPSNKTNESSIPALKKNAELKPGQILDDKLVSRASDVIGPLQITAATNTPIPLQPPFICKQTDGTYAVSFEPPPQGNQCAIHVEYAGQPIDGSAFMGPVRPSTDVKNVKVKSLPVKVNASLPSNISLDASEAGVESPTVYIEGPQGKPCEARVTEQNGHYRVEYTPEEIGKYKVTCEFNGTSVTGFPATIQAQPVGDASKCELINVKRLPSALQLDQEMLLLVDTHKAGNGRLSARVTPVGKPKTPSSLEKSISCSQVHLNSLTGAVGTSSTNSAPKRLYQAHTKDLQDGTQVLSYTFNEPGEYDVQLLFGGQEVPNANARVQVGKPLQTKQAKNVKDDKKTKKRSVEVEEEEEEIEETIEYVRRHLRRVEDRKSNMPDIEEIPEKDAKKSNSKPKNEIKETPLLPVELGELPISVFPDTKKLKAVVSTPEGKKVNAQLVQTANGVKLRYQPTSVGRHTIEVLYEEEVVETYSKQFTVRRTQAGKPYAHGPGLISGQVGRPAQFQIITPDDDDHELTVNIYGNKKVEMETKEIGIDTYEVTWHPKIEGIYRVEILCDQTPLDGSPFTATISPQVPTTVANLPAHQITKRSENNEVRIKREYSEIVNEMAITLKGEGLRTAKVNTENKFEIDTQAAGPACAKVLVEGPSKVELRTKRLENGVDEVSYIPKAPGRYMIHVLFDNQPMPGSPFSVEAKEEKTTVKKQIVEQQQQLNCKRLETNKRQKISIISDYTFEESITATVITPSGSRRQVRLERIVDSKNSDSRVDIWRTVIEEEFEEEGEYEMILLDKRGNPLPQRPVRFGVQNVDSKQTMSVNLQLSGQGLRNAIVNKTAYFTIVPDSPGSLSVRLEGPGKCDLKIVEREEGVYEAQYVVHEEGAYSLHLLVDGKRMPGTPLRIIAVYESETTSTEERQTTRTRQQIQTNTKQTKTEQTSSHKTTKKEANEKVIQKTEKDSKTKPTVPPAPVDEVHVLCERGLVVHGPGLTSGHVIAKRTYEFYVDTRLSSGGKLNVKVDGPGNVQLDLGLCDQGYLVRYSADEAGEYQFTVKYDGQVLAAGPLRVNVLPPDALGAEVKPCAAVGQTTEIPQQQPVTARVTEIKRSGPAGPANASAIQIDTNKLKQTGVGKTAELLVDCENAGEGKLEASLDGIRNSADNLVLSHVSNRVFKVTYTVNEPGEYKLVLRWAGQPLPGSPFSIIAS